MYKNLKSIAEVRAELFIKSNKNYNKIFKKNFGESINPNLYNQISPRIYYTLFQLVLDVVRLNRDIVFYIPTELISIVNDELCPLLSKYNIITVTDGNNAM